MATPAFPAHRFIRTTTFAALLLGSLAWSGCASMADRISPATVARLSPAPSIVDPASAMQQARQYVSTHPGAQVALGSGDSMTPLYKDNTVIVIQHLPMSELKPGMTVVYVSRQGWPVAHALVAKSGNGWVTMGLANPGVDSEKMRDANYVGVVVKAYQMDTNPMLVLSRALSTGDMAMVKPFMADSVAAIP